MGGLRMCWSRGWRNEPGSISWPSRLRDFGLLEVEREAGDLLPSAALTAGEAGSMLQMSTTVICYMLVKLNCQV